MDGRIIRLAGNQRGGTALVIAAALSIVSVALIALAVASGGATGGTVDAGAKAHSCGDLNLKEATHAYPLKTGKTVIFVKDDFHTLTLSNVGDKSFDWASTLGMDAVLVKTWLTTNGYAYDEAYGGKGLKAHNEMDIVSAVFCFDEDKQDSAAKCHDRKGCEEVTPELVTPETEKCTDRKGCPTPTDTPEVVDTPVVPEKCTDRKGCATPTATDIPSVPDGGGRKR